jgi:hypothetical protein
LLLTELKATDISAIRKSPTETAQADEGRGKKLAISECEVDVHIKVRYSYAALAFL